MHKIYVAGPVLRDDSSDELHRLNGLYQHLRAATEAAGVEVTLPFFDEQIDKLPQSEFARAIWSLINQADSLVALLDAPGARPGTNLAVAGEAHMAAVAGKSVAIVAEEPRQVPRLLHGLARFGVHRASDTKFMELFRVMARGSEEAPPTPIAMA